MDDGDSDGLDEFEASHDDRRKKVRERRCFLGFNFFEPNLLTEPPIGRRDVVCEQTL